MGNEAIQCCSQREREDVPNMRQGSWTRIENTVVEQVDAMFTELDANNDGRISRKESTKLRAKLSDLGITDLPFNFDAADVTNSGAITLEEFRSELMRCAKGRQELIHGLVHNNATWAADVAFVWSGVDEDKSGRVDQSELAALIKDLARKEGRIDPEKLEYYSQNKAQKLLRRYDRNGNGLIDKDEFEKLIEDLFVDMILPFREPATPGR
mmetsp:Transcript_129589/g.242464  ORF Transcript_129589/g.242464 Transcript_129589/m.242464 type:complete len:211 (-) Transcript_129589:44-676(-)